MAPGSDISVAGHHLTLESRSATLPEIKPCLSRNTTSPRSKKELIDDMIMARPLSKRYLLKWPPDHLTKPKPEERGILKDSSKPNFSTLPRHKWGASEIEALLKEKFEILGVDGVRHLFQIHQLEQHPETIQKDDFSKVVYHLCGYFTKGQTQLFLEKAGLSGNELITFDEFVAKFKDLEVVKGGWQSPHTRSRLKDPRFNHPREVTLLNLEKGPSYNRQLTAPFAVEQIRAKLSTNQITVEDMFPPACLRARGSLILPPQLKEAFSSQGFDLEPSEFWGLWRRYDLENAGAISKEKLFNFWGLDNKGRPKLKDNLYHRSKSLDMSGAMRAPPTAHSICLDDLNESATYKPAWEVDMAKSTSDPSAPIPKSQLKIKSKELIQFLREKFESPAQQLMKEFEKYDNISCGQVSLALLKKVLCDMGIEVEDESTVEALMSRLDMPRDSNGIYYIHFIHILSSRAEQRKIDAINKLATPAQNSHNSDEADDKGDIKLENAIVQFLASPFYAILTAVKESDDSGDCLIPKEVIFTQMEKHLKISLTAGHKQCLLGCIFKTPKSQIGEENPKVAFHQFMQLFAKSFTRQKNLSSLRQSLDSAKTSLSGGSSAFSTAGGLRQKERPSHSVEITARNRRMQSLSQMKDSKAAIETLEQIQENPTEEGLYNLPMSMLEVLMQEVSKNKVHSLHKAFMLLTKNGKRSMNKLEFTEILAKIGISLTSREIDLIWANLPESTGEVTMEALVARFTPGFVGKNPNAGTVPVGRMPIPISDEELIAKAKEKIAQRKKLRKMNLLKTKSQKCGGQSALERNELSNSTGKQNLAAEREQVREIMMQIKPQVEEKVNELRDRLRSLDNMGHGYVKRAQFEQLFHEYRLDLTKHETDLLCRAFDVHGNGDFHYLRFMELYLAPIERKKNQAAPPIDAESIVHTLRSRILSKWKNLRRAFVQHDLNGDGYLQQNEFLGVLKKHGINLGEDDLYHLMSDIDTNMDGKISYTEFLKYFLV